MSEAPTEAISCNSRSLQELNAYIDRLESSENTKAPFVERKIQFFKPLVTRKGDIKYGSLRPCTILLPSITPSADMLEKEDLSVQLIHQIELAMQGESMFSNKSKEGEQIEALIRSGDSRASSVRTELQKIWDQEAFSEKIKESIFSAVDDRLSRYKEYQSIQIYNKLMRKYSKIKNAKQRNKRLANIEAEVDKALEERHLTSSLDVVNVEDENDESEAKIRIIESGFHPNLVFFDPSLTNEERENGISSICGVNLDKESDQWLLENIWKAVRRDKSPPVPILLTREFTANLSGGYLEIPFDFKLESLVDFLEENLELTRDARRSLLDKFVAI